MASGALRVPRASRALRVPRSRGAISGLLVLLLGVWGAFVPFIGPYVGYAYTPDTTWTVTTGRWVLEVLPGAAAFLGGLILLTSANRAAGLFGGWLAALGGGWFAVGPVLSRLWAPAGDFAGQPVGEPKRQVFEQIGFFTGLGVVILFLAALALGRFAVRGVRDVALTEAAAAERERAALGADSAHMATRDRPDDSAAAAAHSAGQPSNDRRDGSDGAHRADRRHCRTTAMQRERGAAAAQTGNDRPPAWGPVTFRSDTRAWSAPEPSRC